MTIFSRRTLQQLIDENSRFLAKNQIEKHIKNLNKFNAKNYLAYEWEVVVLNAFSKAGEVIHEPNLGSAKKPDILFKPRNQEDISLLADITTISDVDIHDKNPIKDFDKEFSQIIVNKYKFADGNFFYRVEGNYGKDYLKEKRKLRIPKKGKFYEVFNRDDFTNWIEAIQKEPQSKHECLIKNQENEIEFTYTPQKILSFSVQYPSFNQPGSCDLNYQKRNWNNDLLKQNVVYNALKYKARYFKKVCPN